MTSFRTEHDMLGAVQVPAEALYGAHTVRAMENFPLSRRPVHRRLIHAFGAVKMACARTNHELGLLDEATWQALEAACDEMRRGVLDAHIVVDALQGGAGTSTNMNVNEALANRALLVLGLRPGDYDRIHPIDTVNLCQSTNDTYPTALRVAAIGALGDLERSVVGLLEAFQAREKDFVDVVKVGRTQYQDAVLTTLGREMSAYAEAMGRDRWRLYKCVERLRVVNLGGTAIGTGLSAPRQYIFRVVEHLRAITGMGVARSENLVDTTQNTDVFVEVSGILKACAANLLKICGDLRLMSSGPRAGLGEIRLPARQAGSSIMPGKVNPVIPEAVSQAALSVMGHDQAIFVASSLGSLELNAFLPLIADALLTSIDLLADGCAILRRHCVEGMEADRQRCARHVETATATATALVEAMGYEAAQALAAAAQADGRTLREHALEKGLLDGEAFDRLIAPEAVTRLGSPTIRPSLRSEEETTSP